MTLARERKPRGSPQLSQHSQHSCTWAWYPGGPFPSPELLGLSRAPYKGPCSPQLHCIGHELILDAMLGLPLDTVSETNWTFQLHGFMLKCTLSKTNTLSLPTFSFLIFWLLAPSYLAVAELGIYSVGFYRERPV